MQNHAWSPERWRMELLPKRPSSQGFRDPEMGLKKPSCSLNPGSYPSDSFLLWTVHSPSDSSSTGLSFSIKMSFVCFIVKEEQRNHGASRTQFTEIAA
jgi:hypothetical protein